MIGITDGLRYAFARGLIHRDLKMSNILVSSRAEAKIVDFGLASMEETVKDDSLANARTIDYAALERATGVRKDDARSDIYFLGCIYYHMLTGQPPLVETRDPVQRLSKQRFLDVVPIQKADLSLSACVVNVVNKAMTLDPEYRYQSPAVMLADLRATQKRLAEGPRRGRDGRDNRLRPERRAGGGHRNSRHRAVGHGGRIGREDARPFSRGFSPRRISRSRDGRSGQGGRSLPAGCLRCGLRDLQCPADRAARPDDVQPVGRKPGDRVNSGDLAVGRQPASVEISGPAPPGTASSCRCRLP